MTSHSSQGVTAERVLVNMDTRAHPELINSRFAYVSVPRASHEAQIYTDDAAALGQRLSHDSSKTSAIDFRQEHSSSPQQQRKEQPLDSDFEQQLRPNKPTRETTREKTYSPAEHERHYAPLNQQLHPEDAEHFGWKAENGTVQTYQHGETHRHTHIDGPRGQFFDQQKNPIAKEALSDGVSQQTMHSNSMG